MGLLRKANTSEYDKEMRKSQIQYNTIHTRGGSRISGMERGFIYIMVCGGGGVALLISSHFLNPMKMK